jgi:hypothetical protein
MVTITCHKGGGGRVLAALAGVLFVGVTAVGAASPALAQVAGTAQATALVGGTPLIRVTCPPGTTLGPAGGTSTLGTATVFGPAGAFCTSPTGGLPTAKSAGEAVVGGTTFSAFEADCSGLITGGGVSVGGSTFTATTTITLANGSTAVLNEVIPNGTTSVTRNAIHVTSGPSAGIIVGQVVCGSGNAYPLAVDVAGPAAAAPALAPEPSPVGSSGSTVPWLIGGLAALVAAQLLAGAALRRRATRASGPPG